MFSLKTTAVDKALLSVGALIVFTGGYLLSNDHLLHQMLDLSQATEHEVVGEILYSSNDARRRSESSLTWFPMRTNHRIHNRDSLFVGSESQLSFKIHPIDTNIELGPGTLVQVIVGESGPALDFQMGSAEVNFKSETPSPLSILYQGRTLSLNSRAPKGGRAVIQKSPSGNVLIQPIEGSLEIDDDTGQSHSVTPGEQLLLSQTQSSNHRTLVKNLKSPFNETWLWPKDPLRFELNQPVSNGHLKVAQDSNFQRVLASNQINGKTYEINNWTYEGPIYWQVSSDDQALSDDFNLFVLNLIVAPELEFPMNDYSFVDRVIQQGGSTEIEFRFKSRPSVVNHIVEISRNKEFDPLFARAKVIGTRAKLHFDRSGTFYWRVRTDHNHPIDELWSQTGRFWVGDKDPTVLPLSQRPPAPQPDVLAQAPIPEPIDLLSKASRVEEPEPEPELELELDPEPEPEAVTLKVPIMPPSKVEAPQLVALSAGQNAQVSLSWQAVTGATAYQVQVAGSADFSESLEEAETQNTNLRWRSSKPGRVFWRVRSEGAAGEWSDYSQVSSLMILSPAPEAPKVIEARVEVKKAADLLNTQHSVKVALTPIDGASSYALEWSKDPEFVEPQRTIASQSEIEIELEETGTYYARAVAMTAEEEALSQKTDPFEIVYERTLVLQTPRLLQPIDNIQVVSFGDPKDGADDDETTLFFSWQRVSEAQNYRVQFSLSPQFNEILLEKESGSDNLILNQSLPSGRVFWRVRAEREEFSSSWSKPWSIQGGS